MVIDDKCMKCELCLTIFPLKFSVNDIDYDLLNLNQKFKNFLVMAFKETLLLVLKLTEKNEYKIVKSYEFIFIFFS